MAEELQHELRSVNVTVIHPTKKIQNELWGNLHGALRDGTVHIPRDKLLRRQLLSLSIKQSVSGWRVADVPSIHQDRAIAVGGAVLMAGSDGVGIMEFLTGEGYGLVEPADDGDDTLAPVLTAKEQKAQARGTGVAPSLEEEVRRSGTHSTGSAATRKEAWLAEWDDDD